MSANPMTNAMLRTTTAPTIVEGGVKSNVLPSRATAVVNFRLHPRDTPESVLAHVAAAVDDEHVAISAQDEVWRASKVSPIDGAGFRALERAIIVVYPGAVVAPYLVVGGTDSRYYGALTEQIYRFIPVRVTASDRARIHGTNERIAVSALADGVRFYRVLITNGAGAGDR